VIVVAGEALIDLAPREGLLLPLAGGSPYNVAIGLGRLGATTAFAGPLSSDRFGGLLGERLLTAGVSLDLAPRTDEPTTLAVVHLDDRGRASYAFYLEGTSTRALTAGSLPTLPEGAALHVSFGAVVADTPGTGPALTTLLTDTPGLRLTSLDPNVRPGVIADLGSYAERIERLIGAVDLVKVSDEDLLLLHPGADPLSIARRWAGAGPAAVVVTRGPDGAVAVRPDGTELAVPGRQVVVVDTVGAGDAFTAGLLAWLDDHDQLDRGTLTTMPDAGLRAALEHAVHVAAVTCTRAGAEPPTAAEL
jgi:fructokinase